jgi:hypothetical protein
VITIFKKLNRLFLNSQEREFILKNKNIINKQELNSKKTKRKKIFIIQVYWNYYYLLLFKYFIFSKKINENYTIIGIWPTFIRPYRNKNFVFVFLNKIGNLYYYFIKKKWIALYKSIGVNYVLVPLIKNNVAPEKKNYVIAQNIIKRIKTKEDILDLSYKGVPIGDLIYDTVLRFGFKATLEKSDFLLKEIIFKCLNVISFMQQLIKNHKIVCFYSSYSVYIQHGIPARFFLFKSKVKVYTFGNPLYTNMKKLSKNDYLHTVPYKSFNSNFQKIKNKKEKLKIAKKQLERKLSGGDDLSTRNNFVPINTYKSKNSDNSNLKNINGVLFLHDFFDSPHLWGKILYADLYEWAIATIDEIRNKGLKIGIKSHPNSRPESLKINEKLRNKYHDMIWIDKDVSNQIIFKQSNITFGISCFGTVLYEMAYCNKIVLSAGSNPMSSFNFCIQPKSKKQYLFFLNNIHKMKPKLNQKKEVLKLYYMYFLNDYYFNTNQDLTFLKKIDLIKLLYEDNGKIKKFDNLINKRLLSACV